MVSAGNEHNPLGEFDVLAALSHAGHEFIDKRDNGGCLWVPDKPGVEDFLRQSGVFEQFSYSQFGGKATDYKSAWWTRDSTFRAKTTMSHASSFDTERLQFASEEQMIGTAPKKDFFTTEMMLAELSTLVELPSVPDVDEISANEDASEPLTITSEQACLRLLEDLHLPTRWANYFELSGVYSVADLAGKTREDLKSFRGIGSTALSILDAKLREYGLPCLDDFPQVACPACESDERANVVLLPPLKEEIIINPFTGSNVCIGKEPIQRWLFDLYPQGEIESDIIDFADEAVLSDYPELYEAIPIPQRVFYGPTEYIYTFLTQSVDHLITDLGLEAALVFYKRLVRILTRETSFEDTSEAFITSVRKRIPSVMLPVPVRWIRPELNIHNGSLVVRDLLDESSTAISAHIALSTVSSLRDELCECYSQLELTSLLRAAIADTGERFAEREVDVYLKRNGIGTAFMTLEEIAEQYDVTRERIRQIEVKDNKRFNPLCSRRLLPMRLSVLGTAIELGYMGLISELDEALWKQGILSNSESCAGFASLFPEFDISRSDSLFRVVDYPCPDCEKALELLCAISESNEPMSRESFIESVGCLGCEYKILPRLTDFNLPKDIVATDEYVFPKSHPKSRLARRPESVRARVVNILASSGRAMSYDDICDAYFEQYGEDVQKNRVASHMSSNNDVVLWGRGTYIYKDYVVFPKSLIKDVADKCKSLFARNRVPIIGVAGLFEIFQDELLSAGVPTEHALYSLLRMLDDDELTLQEYPWVCDAGTIRERTSFAKYFYSILKANNGFITDEHAKQISERCLAQSFALGGLAEYSDYVINANGGWYDVEAADFDMKGVAEIAFDVAAQMGEDDIISTVKVFEDYRERCVRCGVKSYDILYYLIDMMEDDLPIEATRRPHLVKSDHRGLSVNAAMRLYIQNSPQPVSKAELYEEFITKRRLKLRSICGSILVNDEVVQVGPDLYWSQKKLSIDEDFICEVDEALSRRLRYAKKIGGVFYSRRDVLPSFGDLPAIAALRWNPILLKNVLARSSHFRLFGEQGNCIVSLDENPGITSTEAFFHGLLESEFMGWSPFDSFSDYCKAYMIATDLKPEFFDAYSTISADDISIQSI